MESEPLRRTNRVIGILGGMGPEATLDFYRCIIDLTPAHRDQDHLQVIIYSNPKIPDRTKAIAAGDESPVPYLIEASKILERSGAGIIAMPCNAAHHYLSEMRRAVGIPFLDMVEETSRKLRALLPRAKASGLMATIGTVCSGVYARSLSNLGIDLVLPNDDDQNRIEAAINQVKAGAHNRSTRDTFQSIGSQLMKAGAEAIILGCTEIPLAFNGNDVSYPTLNSTKILAEAAVDWAFAKGNYSPNSCLKTQAR
ncbi:MAG: amino acid racemase [Acidobacteria bacterium]|nr:amino acid racemase [Acidobacteriota bacterium]